MREAPSHPFPAATRGREDLRTSDQNVLAVQPYEISTVKLRIQ